MLREKNKFLILILVLVLLFSLLICVFDYISIERLSKRSGGESGGREVGGGCCEGEGGGSGGTEADEGSKDGGNGGGESSEGGGNGEGGDVGEKSGLVIRVGKCEMCFGDSAILPLFEIYGATSTPYLRVLVCEIYSDGVWGILNASLPMKYGGAFIEQNVTRYVSASHIGFQIIPLSVIEDFIPSVSNPLRLVLLEDKCDLWYYPDQQSFFSEEGIYNDYYVNYVNYVFNEEMLVSASPLNDSRYLDVPQNLFPVLESLAHEIIEEYGAKKPYEMLKAIEDYLRSNYVYDMNYTPPPSGYDPILWFLFRERRGVCIHFNSALVLLARTLGLPARLVGGYLVDPEEYYQVVYSFQAHAYAEVLFEELGWIIFDATGSGYVDGKTANLTRTTTEIIHVDSIGVKGLTFRVLGQVLDERGLEVSGLSVKVYLKRNKTDYEPAIPVGKGIVENGIFNITCFVPLNITVGDYSVIAHAFGEGEYLGSWSDPRIKIMARTYLSAECPEKVIAGRSFSISGFLREVDGNMPVGNESITLICGSNIYQALTDENGSFIINCSIMEPGNYTLALRFNGSEYYFSSICEKPLKVLSLEITPLTKNLLVRGENATISGIVHAEDLSGDNELVVIYFDGVEVAKARANLNGYFSAIYHVSKNYALGKSILEYFLPSNGFIVFQEVKVMAKTQISVLAPEKPMESGKPFNITVSLLNDLREPIPSALIFLNYSYQDREFSENSTTNEYGVALFNISLSVSEEEEIKYLLVFPGNELYLGAETVGYMKVIPAPKSFMYEIYLFLTATMLGSFLSAYFLYRKGWLRKKTASKEDARAQEEVLATLPVVSKKNVNLVIKFPEIKEPFPLVWGLNEKLTVRIEIKGDDAPVNGAMLTLSVDDGESIHLKSSPSGDVETCLTFTEKGVHKLRAYFAGNDEWNEAAAEASIRIVDYREEIVDLFNSFLKSALKSFQGLNEAMTAREIQHRLINQIPESKHGYLEDLVSIFEVADYSLHSITRREYERIFLAKLNLEV